MKRAKAPKRRYKGGAEKARLKKAAQIAEAAARAKTTGEEHPTEKYGRLGLPPDDAIGTIAYANRSAGLLLHGVLTDKTISESDRRKLAKDFIAVIGMTGVKALYEQRLKRLEAKVYGKGSSDENDDGLEDEKP